MKAITKTAPAVQVCAAVESSVDTAWPLDDAILNGAQIFDSVFDGIMLCTRDGLVRAWNPARVRLCGYTSDETIGNPVRMLAPSDAWEEQACAVADAAAGERVIRAIRCLRRDGSVADVLVRVAPHIDAHKNETRLLCILRDVTTSKGADPGRHGIEASLRQSEEQMHQQFLELQQIYNTAPVGRAVLDRNLRYRHVNRRLAEMYGVPATALVGRAVHELSPGAAAPFLRARDVIEAGEPHAMFEIEAETAAHPGECRIWAIAWAPLTSGESTMTGINVVVEDVTEHKKRTEDVQSVAELLEQRVIERTAELRLEAQERQEAERLLYQLQRVELVGQLTSGIAHDFNNMLGVIRANIDILARHLNGRDLKLRRFTEGAILGVERAASLTRQLLGFARRQTLEPKPLDVKKRLLEMTDLFGRTLGEKIVIETLLPDDLWPALVDVSQFENALFNLVINARDAMGGEGRVTIKAANAVLDDRHVAEHSGALPGEYLMISVIDTGVGMTASVLALAFEPFFTTKAERGTGLGLAQVYSFAKQSAGHVTIASTPGEGTSVTIYLPRPAPAPPSTHTTVDDQPIPTATGRETILVVEDDHRVRTSTVDVLRDLGYAVMAAPDGSMALHMLDTGAKVDLLFVDIGLPGELSGPSLADAATARRPDLKVLFASGYSEETNQFGRLSPGAMLLKKPFTYAALATRVRQALSGGRCRGKSL